MDDIKICDNKECKYFYKNTLNKCDILSDTTTDYCKYFIKKKHENPFKKYQKTGWVKNNKNSCRVLITGYDIRDKTIFIHNSWKKIKDLEQDYDPCPAPNND